MQWLFLLLLLAGAAPAIAADERPPAFAIVSAHPLATEAGMNILAAGGNAFDAAVAVAATLAVVEPFNSGLGGGGFFLVHRAAGAHEVVIDARETAPLAASQDMYLDAQDRLIPRASIDGALAAAIPGIPAALEHLSTHYGRLPLASTLAPAIRLAREGSATGRAYQRLAAARLQALRASPAAAAIFLRNGAVPPPGHPLTQSELAATLERIAAEGARGFYTGDLAARLVEGVRAAGGIWSEADLKGYRVIERAPLVGHYHGVRIVSVPPPSSGGTVLIEALNILEGLNLEAMDLITRKHMLIESMRRAYADRAGYLGDPAFVAAPIKRLTSKSYAATLRDGIDAGRATPSETLAVPPREAAGANTTHFSILDAEGNRVAATLSLNLPFGSGFVPAGTGVLLNDEMDDFVAAPGTPNAYRLVGGRANAIEPGKRPLSSMTPTFLETPDRIGILGTPGGSRIISMVLLAALDFADGHGPESWVAVPRMHHQFLPDTVEFEPGTLSEIEQAGLKRRGHSLTPVDRRYGNMQAILWDRAARRVQAAADPRGEGAAVIVPRDRLESPQSTDH
ncbi:MAG: gamma-glutamyltransferase [Chromatiales bacterium]